MSTVTPPEREQSFAETALRLGGKSEEEARRMGAVDRADEQVEKRFLARYQTANSPTHRAIWEGKAPLELFSSPPLAPSHPCERVMNDSLEVVRRHREAGTVLDEKGKVATGVLDELGRAGYWGLLIDPKYGGTGAPRSEERRVGKEWRGRRVEGRIRATTREQQLQ